MDERPNYWAIIPANVRYDKDLRASEKLMYGEITSLTYKTGECWASNNYFAKLYETTPQAISKWILDLEKKGYLSIEYEMNGKECKKRIIKVSTNIDRGINKCLEGYQQKIKENNTSINNKKENIKRKYFEDEELNSLFNDFLELRVKLKAKNTDRAITLLLNELNKWNIETQKQMINNSIMNSWKGLYPLKKTKETTLPEWFGKEIEEEIDKEAEEFERQVLGKS